MLVQTRLGTHTQFMESLSPSEARAYLKAFDRWLMGENPRATDQDYYWRSVLRGCFFPNRKREEADLKRAATLAPDNVDVWVSLGHMAAERKRWAEAVEYYEAGIAAMPDNFFPWYGRAMAYQALGRYDEALEDINTAIAIHPDLAYGYETRGRIHDELGMLEKAADLDFAARCSAATPSTQRYRDELRRRLRRKRSLDW